MSGGGRPDAVRRFLRRPWFWVGVAIVAGPATISLDRQSQRDAGPGRDALRVEAVVRSVDAGSVDIAYDNPLTGQRVETSAPAGAGTIDLPAEGARVSVAVDRADPENVRLAGHRPAPGLEGVALALLLGLPLLWCAIRWWSVHAAERLAGRPAAPTFAMVGALAAPRRVGRRPCLHLWPLDSPPGAEALCAVPVLVSGGLPVGAAFPVEVKGPPRSFGRVVARAGETVLWPAARTLRAPWLGRPAQVDAAPLTLDPPLTVGVDTRPSAIGFLAAHSQVFLGLAASLVLLLAVGTVTFINRGRADDLYRHGREVVAEVTKRGGTSVTVRYTMPGETTVRTAPVAVDWPGDQKIGLKLPAVADPDGGARLRFLRERYDAAEPILWAACPAVLIAGLLLIQLRTWRASGRVAARGPWRGVTARRRGGGQLTYLALSSGVQTATALEVRIPFASVGPLGARIGGPPIRLEMAGDPDPGSPIALRHCGRLLPVSSPARVPRSTDRRNAPPRRWPARRPGTDPAAS